MQSKEEQTREDEGQASPITRRGFIQAGALAAIGLGLGDTVVAGALRDGGAWTGNGALSGGGALGTRAAAGAAASRAAAVAAGERVLVVVNLFGGNDGLNTVVPLAAAEYNRYRQLRKTLRYDREDLLPLNGEPDFGLNPGMTAFQGLFGQGRLAIINGVSVPETAAGLFDHETGQYEFQSCDIVRSTTSAPTGWLGRYLDTLAPGQIPGGVDLGGGRLMLTGAERYPISIHSVRQFQVQVSGDDRPARRAAYTSLMSIPSPDGGVAEQSRAYREEALAESEILLQATASYTPMTDYPDSSLGRQLRECAKIIYADVGARAFAVPVSGFDTHSGQNARDGGSLGYHERLLQDVSESVGAFYGDLVAQGLSGRVLILTVSEFGRRAYENRDKGTDHGFGSLAFALGDAVHGGIYRPYPSLDALVLDGNLAVTTDFRSVYASALGGFLDADPAPILGGSFPLVPFV